MNPLLINEIANSDVAKNAQQNIKTARNIAFIGGGSVLLFFIGRYFYRKNKKEKEERQTVDDAKNDINPKDVTLQESWFSQAADSLQIALTKGVFNPFVAPDKLTIYLILQKLKTKSDWLKLVSKFGIRTDYASGIWNESLITWLRHFINDQAGTNYIRSILKKIDVTY